MKNNLDRIIQFYRYTEVEGDYGLEKKWAMHGGKQWAKRTDVTNREAWLALEVSATITTRFLVRWSDFTADITPKDTIVSEGRTYDITGIREVSGRREYLEINAAARADG